MKKEKNLEDKDKEIVEIIETENFEVSKTGSLADDLMQFEKINDIKIENQEVPEIEVQEIYIRETGNYLNLQENFINIPIEMIYFPFFTPQKQNKRINFKYTFEDLGVTMYSTLIPKDKKDKVFQPSVFEEKIYTFLISMYQEKTNSNPKVDDNEVGDDSEVAIEFEISDFIVNFLGNKMNRAYYAKVEQALKNLKNTIYQFEISNHTKFGKNKFEDSSFQLLNYQKLKVGKKTFYRVVLNKNIVNKIKSKRYIKYNTKNLLEIMIKDPIASRIYKYISKIRYKNNKGEINVRTLAAIIPLKIEQRVERIIKNGVKEYYLNRMKPVLTRILKAFEVLLELKYLISFEEIYKKEENTYYIAYVFNKERDGDCHVSEFVKKNDKNIVKENLDGVEEIIDVDADIEYQDNLEYLINKAKENPKISMKWNAWVDKKIQKILKEDGEEMLKRVLNILIHMDKNIEIGLPNYISGILKNIGGKGSKKVKNINMTIFENVSKGKGLKSKNQIKQARKKGMEKISNIKEIMIENNFLENKIEVKTDTLLLEGKISNSDLELNEAIDNVDEKIYNIGERNLDEILSHFDETTRNEIEEKALEKIKKEIDNNNIDVILNVKKFSKTMYYKMIGTTVMEILKSEYQEMLEDTKKNDK
ncbi:chromosomal replication initiator DnaA [Fusobacterium hwasookii ChDC F174]|uniref:Chromosomal replication initiator DnaA n=1 Tax=Fusobacterium hwasookii ChDC F174 TaxID=1307442 RepID=A0A0S2ZKF5_9FUSO|nr:replication initiator protein A [Fusobacterium hwasookii]ALQ39413.1 chromosomal replication initiator DnaA [Fusobacterium hwasookii ChDC F174]